jgi:hypothetical protein
MPVHPRCNATARQANLTRHKSKLHPPIHLAILPNSPLRPTTPRSYNIWSPSSAALMAAQFAWPFPCYALNGEVQADPVPCSTLGGPCCPLSHVCMSTGLCYYPQNVVYTSDSCTDPNWEDPACPPKYCVAGKFSPSPVYL